MEKKKCNLWSINLNKKPINQSHSRHGASTLSFNFNKSPLPSTHQHIHSIITFAPHHQETSPFLFPLLLFVSFLYLRPAGDAVPVPTIFLIHKTTAQSRRCTSLSFFLHNPFNVNYLRTHAKLIIKIFVSF